MNRIATAREALIVEVLDEMGKLINRVEALPATLDNAREEMRDAAFLLDSRVEPFQHQMRAAVEQSKTIAINDVRRLTFELTAASMEEQKEAMQEAARAIVREEVGPTLRELAASLKALVERLDRPWESWLIHLATVGTTVACVFLVQFFVK